MEKPQKLSQYAKAVGIPYSRAYDWHVKGKLSVPTYKDEGGTIYVGEKPSKEINVSSVSTINTSSNSFNVAFASNTPAAVGFDNDKLSKIQIAEASGNSTRTNRSSTIQPLDRFANIDQVPIPYRYDPAIHNSSGLTIKDILRLVIKCYYGYAIVRNTIDSIAGLCTSNIYLEGGSKKSRDFFTNYFKFIKLNTFCQQFFLEYFKTANVYIFKKLGKLRDEDLKALQTNFDLSTKISYSKSGVKLPISYITLNPVAVEIQQASSYFRPVYRMLLSDYELGRLKNIKTQEDQEIFDNLPDNVKKLIKKGSTNAIYIDIDSSLIKPVYYNKASYESFAIPPLYAILDLLEYKTSLLKIDNAIAKTCQNSVLLITHGSETKGGEIQYNQRITDSLQAIFQNESVGRVLIADYTVRGEWLIPPIGDILNPAKYQVINDDLKEGLGHILFGGSSGGEKFSNQESKVRIFIDRLRAARQIFIDEFLMDEVINISNTLGFRDIPTPKFEDIDLSSTDAHERIVTQLAQFGYLTPEETFEALKNNKLPTAEDSLEHQADFVKQKKKGFYEPITGGPFTQNALADKSQESQLQQTSLKLKQQNGRPPGINTKLSGPVKKKPVGHGSEELQNVVTSSEVPTFSNEAYSLTKIKDNLILASKLEDSISSKLKKLHKIKGNFNDEQKNVLDSIVNLIITDHEPKDWESKAAEYIKKPIPQNSERQKELQEIAYNHQVNDFIGGILLNSKKEVAPEVKN